MDDLFRQASDQYPLRTDSSDWGKLSGALEAADPSLTSPQVKNKDNKRRRKRILWLFLPLLAGGIGYYAWQSPHAGSKTMASRQLQNQNQEQQNNDSIQKDQVTGQQNNLDAKAVPGDNMAGAEEHNANDHNKSITGLKSPVSASSGGNAMSGKTARTTMAKEILIPAGSGSVTGSDRAGSNTPDRIGSNTKRPAFRAIYGGTKPEITPGSLSKIAPGSTPDITPVSAMISRDAQYSRVASPGRLTKGDISVSADIRSKWQKTPGAARVIDPSQQKKLTANSKPRKHSIYVGILGAPDLSTIDFQAVKSVGTTYGILAGYTFNSKFSLETGVYLDKKKYFTDGHYFNTEKVPALQNPYYDLRTVNGDCNMVEIPLNLRYNLFGGKQRTLFATAGLSTYLMSKEWYAYQIASNYGMVNKSSTYTNPYHYLFSIIDLSFGYEQKLGKIGNLRIEPYLRIPLSGIGTGSLSILSAGLNLGITRRIW